MQFKETYKTLFSSLLPQLVSEIADTSLKNANLTIPSAENDPGLDELILQETQKIIGFVEDAVMKSSKFDAILGNFEESINKFLDLKQSEINREEIDKENAALVEEAISRALSQKASPPPNTLPAPSQNHVRINSATSVGSSTPETGSVGSDKIARETSKKEYPRKASGFGFKNMLSSLTKSRPAKPVKSSSKASGLGGEKSVEGEPTSDELVRNPSTDAKPQPLTVSETEPHNTEQNRPIDVAPTPPLRTEPEEFIPGMSTTEQEETLREVQAKKYVPTNAMAAMALAMKSGLSSTNSMDKVGLEDDPQFDKPRSSTPQSITVENNKISSPPAQTSAPVPPPRSRPTSVATDDSPTPPSRIAPSSQSEKSPTDSPEIAPPVPAIRPRPNSTFDLKNTEAPPKTAAKSRPATWFDAPSSDASSGASPRSGDIRNSMRPMVLPRPVSSYNPPVQIASSQPQIFDGPVDLNSIDTGEDVSNF